MHRTAFIRALFLCLLCLPGLLSAQTTTGSLTGLITDATGAAVIGAKVTARNVNTNAITEAETDGEGQYRIINLPASVYEVTVTAHGFRTATLQQVRLLLNAIVRNDIALSVGQPDQKVEVTAAPATITTDSSSLASVIDTQAAERLPLNGRTIDRLIVFSAGNTNDSASSPQLSGGLRWGGSYFTVDGGNFNDLGNGAGAYSYATNLTTMPSTETIQEMKIESNMAKAESEGAAAISIITRSGTNQFHGRIYEFNRNRALAARNYFLPSTAVKPPYNRNEFGVTFGGPIIHDKTFFFVSYEGLIQRTNSTVSLPVATDAMRNGNFTGLGTITDPLTGLPFAGNQIPTSRIDARSQALLGYYPHANLAGSGAAGTGINYTAAVGTKYNVQRGTLKLDHQLNSKHTITVGGIYSIGDPYFVSLGTPANYGNFSNAGYTTQSAFARDTYVITPHLLNEARYGYLSHRSVRVGQNTGFDPSTLFPSLYGPFSVGGLPNVSMTGLAGLGDYGGSGHSPETVQQLTDNFTWSKGAHTFKAGANINFDSIAIKAGTSANVLGNFGFTGKYTWYNAATSGAATPRAENAFADFLLGYLNSSTRAAPQIPIYLRYQQYGFYAQDDWNVTPRLVLNIGMRYNLQTSPQEQNGDFTNFDFNSGKFVIRSSGGNLPKNVNQTVLGMYPYITSEQNGWGSDVLTTDKKDFGPRFGFAYRPNGFDKTVIRGGYGIFYNFVPPYIGIRQISQLNFPFVLTQSYLSTSSLTPSLTFANPFPGTGTVTGNPTVYAVNRDLKNARSQQWNLSIEQQLMDGIGLRISYVGNKATQAPWYLYNKNLPVLQPTSSLQAIRPYQPWADIPSLITKGASFTNQLQVEVTRHTSKGVFLQGSYTWGKSLDNVPIAASPQNPYRPQDDKGNADGTRQHNVFLNASWDLPLHGTGFVGGFINGWSIAGMSQFRSGAPFTPTFSNGLAGWYATRANVTATDPYAGAHTLSRWFNPAAFSVPAPYTFGNARRNSLIGPRESSIDLSLQKTTTLYYERLKLQIRADAFNAPNHPSFSSPSSNISAATAGKISSTNLDNRTVQLGAKLSF
ncbi:TonB-dependent receptor [Edaphobacter flagellatus]|uniref:TonB-dependent receptor n=1 Tax=Edaphobacter flagellatus TaxID=1933044 RepID=UPI0021B30524|nr:TonB-dependent receptor [Edaphobacter flagellatus]